MDKKYEELSLSGFRDEMKEVSSGPHSRKFCFVLGAGASKTSGIKSGQELVDIWDKELLERNREEHLKWKTERNIDDSNKYSFYSEFYERRFRRRPVDGYNYLEKLMEHAKPSIGYVMLSYLLTKKEHNVVITTNFDHLAEDAVNYYTQTIPLIIGHESLAHYISKQINRPTIIKIHRDLLFDPKNRTEELEILHDNWKKALGIVFSEYHPIFIGYAGNDNSLMDFLLENSEKFIDGEWAFPYWMIYKTEEVSGKVLEFLNKSVGYVIRHNGFDEVMYLLGAAFDYKLPSKEDFLSDAEKRYQTLSNYIDEFTKKSASKKELLSNEKDVIEKNDASEGAEIEQAIEQITSQTELQRMYREAVVLHNIGKYADAVKIEEKLIEMAPKNARYHNSLGITLYEMKRPEEALIEKKRAIELEPDNAEYHDSLGTTFHEMKRYEEALVETQRAIELEPDNAEYHRSLGVTLHEMKRYEEALIEKRRAVELEPDSPRYHNSLSATLHKMKRHEEALIETLEAVELEPDNAEYHNSLGVTLHEMERYEEALAETQRAIELEPDNAEYHNSLGVTLHEMKRYEEALVEKQKAVELKPDNAEYYRSLGVTLYEMKRYEEALAEKRRAVELEPDNAEYHDSLGVTLHEMKRYEEALVEKRRAVELEPNSARYHRSLGVTLYKMKKYEEAVAEMQKAVELESDNAEYRNLLNKMLSRMKK